MVKVIEIKAHPDPRFVLITYEQILPDIPGYKKKFEKITGFQAGGIKYRLRIGDILNNYFIKIIRSDTEPIHECFDFDKDFPINEEYWKEEGKFYYYKIFHIEDPNEALDFLITNYFTKDPNSINDNNELNRFVTNATANSIAFYAMTYLNRQGYSPKEIYELRRKLSLENLNSGEFTKEELLLCFEKQSAYFLNLYKEMNENDRFENFAKNLNVQGTFKETFKNFSSVEHLMTNYHRKIYHKYINKCELIHNNYEENNIIRLNTKVFGVKTINEAHKLYVLTEDYLLQLGMRICKECKKINEQLEYNKRLKELENENNLPF